MEKNDRTLPTATIPAALAKSRSRFEGHALDFSTSPTSKKNVAAKVGFSAALLAALTVPASAQTVTIDTVAPTDVIAQSTAFGTTESRIFDIDSNTNHARGNRFILPASPDGYEITAVTINANGAHTYVDDTLSLFIYQGTTAEWNTGTGHVATDSSYYLGTTVTPLTTESAVFSGSPTAGNYVTFTLATPIVVSGETDFGFFFTFDQGLGTNNSFYYRESGTPADANDGRTAITTTAHNTSGARQMNYYIHGSVVDAGIINPTISASEEFITAGDPVDLDITFDPTADTATLNTSGGIVNLITLDDGVTNGDPVAGDGEVLVTDFPTNTINYMVDTTKAGETPESISVEVLVANPGDEAADNSFSLALKSDSPLFYYRFEEAADTRFLLDSSGNGYHTNDYVGDLGQGSGPGGMQNAGQFPGNVGINVPATASTDTSLPYTMVAVVNSANIQAGSKNIFSMKDGTGTGRSLLYLTNGHFETFAADNAATIIPATTVPESQTSFLMHCVFDPDPDADPLTADQEMRLYIDGALQGAVTLGAVDINIGQWVLGSHKARTFNFFNGWLDETAVFESALSDVQIAAHGAAFLGAGDPLLGFDADNLEINAGESVTLSWKISDQATAVTINGVAQTISGGGTYTTVFSPVADTTYTIEVTGPGGPFIKVIDVTVLAPPGPAKITAISVDGASPPNVTLTITGDIGASYDIMASENLADGFPVFIHNFVIPGSGEYEYTFAGVGTAEFYRVELAP